MIRSNRSMASSASAGPYRLIEQDQDWFERERSGDGHALALAA